MRRFRLTSSARRNLGSIARHLRVQGVAESAAVGIIQSIGAQCRKLAELPGELGRPRPDLAPGLRSFPFRGYVIFFRYSESEFEVINVLSGRQDHTSLIEKDDD